MRGWIHQRIYALNPLHSGGVGASRSIHVSTSCSHAGWHQSVARVRAAACSGQAGLRMPGRSTSDARAGSRSWDPNPLVFLSYGPLLLLFMCCGTRRGTLQPQSWFFCFLAQFLCFCLFFFLCGRRCSLSKNTNLSGISHRSGLQMKPDGS